MRIKIDKDSDTLYFRLDENSVVESEEVRSGVVLDFDKNDRVVGVEFLGFQLVPPVMNFQPCSSRLHKKSPDLRLHSIADSVRSE